MIEPNVMASPDARRFATGAVRDAAADKGRPSLIPFAAIARLSQQLERGANKYEADNFRKGMPFRDTADSMLRHLYKWVAGLDDEDHLAAVMFGAAALMEFEDRINEGTLPASLDDRFKDATPGLTGDKWLAQLRAEFGPREPQTQTSDAPPPVNPPIKIQCATPDPEHESRALAAEDDGTILYGCKCGRKWVNEEPFSFTYHCPDSYKKPFRLMDRVYVSGPMSGIVGFNRTSFAYATAFLRHLGNEAVVNPHELDAAGDIPIEPGANWTVDEDTHKRLLERDFKIIDNCDSLFMLPGWEHSQGANAELDYAISKGKHWLTAKEYLPAFDNPVRP